ncbi:MAG: hypothetical protein KAX65_03915, partial [Caldilineaceae bacterium]|nr:hypothetical protein [Caldilineaceae bacterium]
GMHVEDNLGIACAELLIEALDDSKIVRLLLVWIVCHGGDNGWTQKIRLDRLAAGQNHYQRG